MRKLMSGLEKLSQVEKDNLLKILVYYVGVNPIGDAIGKLSQDQVNLANRILVRVGMRVCGEVDHDDFWEEHQGEFFKGELAYFA